jgi:hypothetical protein
MNTPTSKSFHKRQTNQKFRRLLNSLKDTGNKLSGQKINFASWDSGYVRKDLPKEKNIQ